MWMEEGRGEEVEVALEDSREEFARAEGLWLWRFWVKRKWDGDVHAAYTGSSRGIRMLRRGETTNPPLLNMDGRTD